MLCSSLVAEWVHFTLVAIITSPKELRVYTFLGDDLRSKELLQEVFHLGGDAREQEEAQGHAVGWITAYSNHSGSQMGVSENRGS